jgi:hypothetical protein
VRNKGNFEDGIEGGCKHWLVAECDQLGGLRGRNVDTVRGRPGLTWGIVVEAVGEGDEGGEGSHCGELFDTGGVKTRKTLS